MLRKRLNKKVMSFLIVICFLTISLNQCIAEPNILEDPTTLCYGFIVPSFRCENATIENQINCKIRHMINDLLREQIPVFWTTINLTVLIREVDICKETEEMFFEKGTFVIPFTGNHTQDTKLIAVIYDYNQSGEIEENNIIGTPVYLLMESLNIQVYPLSEVKIAQYESLLTGCEYCYLEIARKCGFLTFECLEDKILAEKLENDAFNVIVWPSGGIYGTFFVKRKYPLISSVGVQSFYIIIRDLKYAVSSTVRKFVANGSGYIGSCYGAAIASCGIQVGSMQIYLKRRVYNPKLRSLGILAISDVIDIFLGRPGERLQEKIVNDSHPVTYGLDKVVISWGGSWFKDDVGENSKVIAVIHNTTCDDCIGLPSWISSTFGDGKVMVFGTHPECMVRLEDRFVGNKIISNSLYYTTSKEMIELDISQSRNLSFILNIWEKTANLTLGEMEDIFNEIKTNISEIIDEITNLSGRIQRLQKLIEKMAEKKNIDDSEEFLDNVSTNEMLIFWDYFIKYLRNTTKTLDKIEEIYPLLDDDTNFLKRIENLTNDLSQKINKIKNIISKGCSISKYYEKLLNRYQKLPRRAKFREMIIEYTEHKIFQEVRKGFHYIPQTYFNSLKLLRTSWYNYEASIAI